jgi:proteasome lid subunit RPN8/RPN11
VSENSGRDSIKENFKKKIKEQLKKEIKEELLNEIYQELLEENGELAEDISNSVKKRKGGREIPEKAEMTEPPKGEPKIKVSIKALLKISTHALKYANENIPREEWVEVIGLLAGRLNKKGGLTIENAYPIAHGNAIHVQMNEDRNKKTGYLKAYEESRKSKLFICGWYHSHPSYGCFMSDEDLYTQSEYQKHWEKAVALVVDPYEIDGTSYGFKVFRADLNTGKWYSLPFDLKESLDVAVLPKLLEFINPIVDGKALFLEYDEE